MPPILREPTSQDQPVDVLIIGGGAAGLMAAGQAAALGATVCLLEKMERPARKLRISGKGRCNFTNTAGLNDFLLCFDQGGKFLRPCFSRFFNTELIRFFQSIGIAGREERGGRVFPDSSRGQDVVDGLVGWCKKQGVLIRTGCTVVSLEIDDRIVRGVWYETPGESQSCRFQGAKQVIITTGGASYPGTGSTGDGFRLAEEAGHTLEPIHPALVPLTTKGDTASRLQGLSLINCGLKLAVDGKRTAATFGEMLFTHFGVSGPIILSLSSRVVRALQQNKKVRLHIDLKPGLEHKQLDQRLQRDLLKRGKQEMSNIVRGLLPRKLVPVCLEQTGIPPETTGSRLTADERKRLRLWLKDFQLEVDGHLWFEDAIVTAGGVLLREVDPRTMASRLINGLYFAGEVLDIHADTGGYNLQAAFSTGWTAGRAAAITSRNA